MLHALGHEKDFSHTHSNDLIGALRFRFLRRGGVSAQLESQRPAAQDLEDFVRVWVGVPDERALDFGDFQGVT